MRRKALVGILLVCLMLGIILLSVSVCVAKESTSLPTTPFMHVEIKDLRYDVIYGTGMAEGGSEVSIKLILTNVSKEIDESTFSFQSELVGAGGHVSVDGQSAEALQSGGSYTLKHKQVVDEVVISWSGEAPEVGKRAAFTLLNVTQETTEGEYSVVDIKIDVTSQTIEDAIIAVNNANEAIAKASTAIADAEDAGLNVADAKESLVLANEYLNNSQQYYNEGRSEEALEEANKALNSAKDAEAKAESALKSSPLSVTPTPTPVLPISPKYLYAIPIALFLILLPLIFYIRGKSKKPAITTPEMPPPSPEQKVKEQEQITPLISKSITLERAIYDPCKRDFIEGRLPRMKEWINRYDPGAYWFAMSIQNNTNKAIDKWGVELETSSALKVEEVKIEGMEYKIELHETYPEPFKSKYIIGVPKEYGIVIPKGGAQRIYFKLRADKPKTTYEISGVFKSVFGEVPIRAKEFKYLCDAGVSSEAVKAELKKTFSEKDAARLALSFKIVQQIDRMCDQEAKTEEYLNKLSSLKGYTEGFSENFTNQLDEFSRFMKQEQLEYLDDAYRGKVKRFCTNLVDVWISEFLKG